MTCVASATPEAASWTSRTVMTRSNSDATGASRFSVSRDVTPSGRLTMSIIEKCPLRIVDVASSRLHPSSNRTRVTAATIPVRSFPMTVTAARGDTRFIGGNLPAGGFVENVAHVVVPYLGEVVEVLPHRKKGAGRRQNHDVVIDLEQRFYRLRRTNGDREDEPGRLVCAKDTLCRLGRAARSKAVVHHDDGPALEGRFFSVTDPASQPSLDLLRRRGDQSLESARRDPHAVYQGLVDVDDSSASHRSDSKFGLTGRADLANDDYLQRGSERLRDLVRDLDTTARQPDHHGVGILEVAELAGEIDSRRPSIWPSHVGH